jgi:hypothetical protein
MKTLFCHILMTILAGLLSMHGGVEFLRIDKPGCSCLGRGYDQRQQRRKQDRENDFKHHGYPLLGVYSERLLYVAIEQKVIAPRMTPFLYRSLYLRSLNRKIFVGSIEGGHRSVNKHSTHLTTSSSHFDIHPLSKTKVAK